MPNYKDKKAIEDLIVLYKITDSSDEMIESIADRFPHLFSNEQEYMDLQLIIVKIIERINKTKKCDQ